MKKITVFLLALAVLFAGTYLLFEHNFEREIQQTAEATVYVEGKPAGTTTVTIDGRHVYSLLSPYRTKLLNFYGSFRVEAVLQTCRDGTQMHIYGLEDSHIQYIEGYYAGDFFIPLGGTLLISFDMTEFALQADTATIIATSEELYEAWIALNTSHSAQ